MNRYDQLEKLQELRSQGALTEEEFQTEKQRLLAPTPPPLASSYGVDDGKIWGMDTRTYCMLLHLSQFAGFLVPFFGLALPIVMWAVNKDQSTEVDAHGKVVLNWLITELILALIFAILIFVFIGIPLLIALAIIGFIYPIVGAVKAMDGEVWSYPGTIRFL